jgi:hypothetical protein
MAILASCHLCRGRGCMWCEFEGLEVVPEFSGEIVTGLPAVPSGAVTFDAELDRITCLRTRLPLWACKCGHLGVR